MMTLYVGVVGPLTHMQQQQPCWLSFARHTLLTAAHGTSQCMNSRTQALDKVQADWEAAELTILDFRDTGTCVVKLEEAMVQQLDDHIVMLQSMSFSPHRKPFEERLAKWDTTLNLVSWQPAVHQSQGCSNDAVC